MDFREIERKVIEWAEDRLIYEQSNSTKQLIKLVEELNELVIAIKEDKSDEVVDAIGDMIVVLTHIAYFNNCTLTYCYKTAYDEIKDRKGKMINGVFVKEQ